ncbi:nuclear transport factor 2 family protein [Bradyrhizobium sp. CCGUVB23]|uniref:nuclear transport factor 2 family protein n=1 Tax=Bradyrhizobium sp. CCGUVB23 TaxID=2949630 RepID=UPI0020B455D7|nr:nuclear transport factor 2 family protein [Bradyrhizobium sp. CCGUVB23]MCP3462770.1 nuclear transport factor 2 family protein [Bradyrhizobium sp. CCGUVB23]
MEKPDALQYIVKKEIRKTFDHVNNHRWDEAVKAVAPHVHHRVSGAHALGGERHNKEDVRRWFERLGRVLPTLQLTVDNIWVKGWPWHTTVFAQWDATATLLNGDASYVNRGLHVFTLRWGRVYALEEFQDSQEAARGLAAQAAAGLKEAVAEPIVSEQKRSQSTRAFLGKRGSLGAHLLQEGASVRANVEEIGEGK